MDYWIWLANIEGLGAVSKLKALQKFRTAEAFYNASKEEILMLKGFSERTYEKIFKSKDEQKIIAQEEFMKTNDIKYINFFDDEYPENLRKIYDMPITLFYKGEIGLLKKMCVAIVGSRNASKYGVNGAYSIGKELGKAGYVVVSGVARGIDTFSHKGCLEGGGMTIGVLGCGIDIIYPAENEDLYKRISDTGLLISEYPVGMRPFRENFPMRNRIISGISDKIIVIEAALKSGTMITVECALEQGKDVYAVPGNISSNLSAGTNNLIKDGAGVYTCVEDLGG